MVAAVVIALVVLLVGSWSRSTQWTSRHTTALAIGAFLVGAVAPFLNKPYDVEVSAGSELLSDLVAVTVCLAVVGATLARRAAYPLAR